MTEVLRICCVTYSTYPYLLQHFLQTIPPYFRVDFVSASGWPLPELAALVDKIIEAAVVHAGTAAIMKCRDSSPSLATLASNIPEVRWASQAQEVPYSMVLAVQQHLPSLSAPASDKAQMRSAMRQL